MRSRPLLPVAALVLLLASAKPAPAETTLARAEPERPLPEDGAGAGRLVNADAVPHQLELRCGDVAWTASVEPFETVALALPAPGHCELRVAESASAVSFVGGAIELRIESGVLRETVRPLRWSILLATYGQDGPWPAGVVRQWASSARASTQYSADSWSAAQATGAPDTHACADAATAWAPLERQTTERHWIRLRYPRRVRALGARLHVTLAPGAVKEIQARTGSGWETVWAGSDPTRSCPAILSVVFTEEVDTDTIRVVVDLSRQENWFELDAVKLLGTAL